MGGAAVGSGAPLFEPIGEGWPRPNGSRPSKVAGRVGAGLRSRPRPPHPRPATRICPQPGDRLEYPQAEPCGANSQRATVQACICATPKENGQPRDRRSCQAVRLGRHSGGSRRAGGRAVNDQLPHSSSGSVAADAPRCRPHVEWHANAPAEASRSIEIRACWRGAHRHSRPPTLRRTRSRNRQQDRCAGPASPSTPLRGGRRHRSQPTHAETSLARGVAMCPTRPCGH